MRKMRNPIIKALATIDKFPAFLRPWLRNIAFGRTVSYVGTTGVKFEKITKNEWIAIVKNKRHVRNHIKQVHAGAMLVVAETVSVFLTAMNVPGDRLPLVKKIEADFVRRSEGTIRAVAKLTDKEIQFIHDNEKGELLLEVIVTDESGERPVIVYVTAAWIPKKRDESLVKK